MRKLLFSWALCLILPGLVAEQAAAQQVKYLAFETIEGVEVSYRWHRSSVLNRQSDAVLNLQFVNQTAFPLEVEFDLGFYRDEQLMFASEENRICLRPGQRRRGLRAGLRFTAPGIKMDMVDADWFSWGFIHFEATEVDNCN